MKYEKVLPRFAQQDDHHEECSPSGESILELVCHETMGYVPSNDHVGGGDEECSVEWEKGCFYMES